MRQLFLRNVQISGAGQGHQFFVSPNIHIIITGNDVYIGERESNTVSSNMTRFDY
jgi:hypothetical protein